MSRLSEGVMYVDCLKNRERLDWTLFLEAD